MFCKPIIRVNQLSKIYPLYHRPSDRLKQFLWRGKKQFYQSFCALENINFELDEGDILGIIGRNGAGKSTLLQLLCGTLTPTSGEVSVAGRIAALLELGAGFNPEFSGRENIWMSAAILGLNEDEIAQRYDDIVAFSGIGDFIEQPVKTYSSGMYVRLAFSVATSVEPDILIIDEALSVGDGAFAHQSFKRIMQLRDQGKTILFCSHSMYQIEALCNKVLWLDGGRMKALGQPAKVTVDYTNFLTSGQESNQDEVLTKPDDKLYDVKFIAFDGKITQPTKEEHAAQSQLSDLIFSIHFISPVEQPCPHFGLIIQNTVDMKITSASSHQDQFSIPRDSEGHSQFQLTFPLIALLKGNYTVNAYLLCQDAIHVYDQAIDCFQFTVVQQGLEQGVVHLTHQWSGGH